ncbi:hypothetical protein MFIFM68171_05623 [Madurella fahalii]|uniref:GED domain-containing protein n=1 Tax=Madurella fahalii TaxID=1157608 RepID=A0ABQ0GCE9_9PEZI
MTTKGARYRIEWDKTDATEALGKEDKRDEDFPEYLQEFIIEYNVPDPEPKPEWELNAELQSQASHNQGKEFPGEANGELALQLFREQAAPWQDIASMHLKQALKVTKQFVEQAFIHVIGGDVTTLEAVLSGCVDPFFEEKEEVLQAKLREVLVPYTNGYGLPLENEFRERMDKRTLRRLAGQLSERLEQQHPELFKVNLSQHLTRHRIEQAIIDSEESKSDEFGTRKVIDMMMTYYDLSLRTFLDNVINLAVESCLVCDIPTILTPRKVNAMSADRMKELASESEEVQRQRLDLQNEVRILTEGLRKCQRHKPRELAGLLPARSRQHPGAGSGQTPSDTRAVTPSRSPIQAGDPTPTPSLATNTNNQVSSALLTPVPARPAQTSPMPSLFSTAPAPDPPRTGLFAHLADKIPGSVKPPTPLFCPPPASKSAPGTSLFGDATVTTGGGLFGGSSNAAASGPGPGPASGTSLFGSVNKTQDSNTGTARSGGGLFGSSSNATASGPGPGPASATSLFGSANKIQDSNNTGTARNGGGLFGSSSNAAAPGPGPASGSSLFGTANKASDSNGTGTARSGGSLSFTSQPAARSIFSSSKATDNSIGGTGNNNNGRSGA